MAMKKCSFGAGSASVYMLYEDSLWSVPAAGGSTRQVTTMDNAQSFDYHFGKTKVYWVDDESDKVSENENFNFESAPLVA